jgi:hypothetical protein
VILFDFEYKNHPNREIKMHVVWLVLKSYPNQTKSNQINAVRIGSVVAVYDVIFWYETILNIAKKT